MGTVLYFELVGGKEYQPRWNYFAFRCDRPWIKALRTRAAPINHNFIVAGSMRPGVGNGHLSSLAGSTSCFDNPWILRGWIHSPQFHVWMPGYFLFKFLPFYDGMRVRARYGIFVMVALSAVAGVGFALLVAHLRSRAAVWSLTFLVIVGIGIEFFPNYKIFTPVQPRPVDIWLSQQPDNGAVAQMPPALLTSPEMILGTLTTHKPELGMFYGAYLPKNFTEIMPILDQFPNKASLKVLQARHVHYVVVEAAGYQDWESVRAQILALGFVERGIFDGEYVYELPSRN